MERTGCPEHCDKRNPGCQDGCIKFVASYLAGEERKKDKRKASNKDDIYGHYIKEAVSRMRR